MIPAALLALALALSASPTASVEVRLANGRRLKALSATRQGAEWVVVTTAGTLRLPAAKVAGVAPLAAEDPERSGGFNVLEGPATPAAGPGVSQAKVEPPAPRRPMSEGEIRDALVAAPGDGKLLLALGRLLVDSGRFSESLEPLTAARSLGPRLDVDRALLLAEAYSRLDRTDEARAALALAPRGDARVAAMRRDLDTDSDLRGDRILHESEHFTIQAPPDVTVLDSAPLVERLESIHALLASALGGQPHEKIIVILYRGSEFWDSTGMGHSVGGLYDGKVRVPAGRVDPPTRSLEALLRHEVAHAFVDSLSAGRADRTWQEGIAEHFEGDDIRAKDLALGEAYRRNPSEWPPSFDHDTSHSLVEFFLSRHGVDALRELLASLREGGTIPEAIHAATGEPEAALHAAWGRRVAGLDAR